MDLCLSSAGGMVAPFLRQSKNVWLVPPPRSAEAPNCGKLVRCSLQGQEERRSAKRISPETFFKVAGISATIAALVFTLPIGGRKESVETEDGRKSETARVGTAKRKGKTATKKGATMPLEERQEWTKGLPVVGEKMAYTDLVRFKEQGKLKHIIKSPISDLRTRPEIVFVVLSDDRVVRTVLPASDRDQRFWNAWGELQLDSYVVNAFTPPPPTPEKPSLPAWLRPQEKIGKDKRQPKQMAPRKGSQSATRMRVEELERARKDLEKARIAAELQRHRQRELKSKVERQERANTEAVKEQQERQKRENAARLREEQARKEKLVQQVQLHVAWDDFWYTASRNEGFRFVMGMAFFWLFYQTVVVGIKKRKRDYEDRLKIEMAEEEERQKMREWEDEMEALETVTTVQELGSEKLSEAAKRKLEEAEQNPQLQLGLRFMRSGARVRRARGQRRLQYLDQGIDVKFSDVAGLGDIRRELEEVVEFFTYREKYQRRGSKIPSGILLCGEPGTGKTLLAKAVAGEAGVNFFSISASQFVEIYVGVGASRVRALYQEAKENAPAVVFIDELDAVGRQRGLIGGSGGQERDATLNQLLTCLDGFEGKGEVITIAATNRPDVLDIALVRPGRFDRKIYIPKPGSRGRVAILKVHAKNKPMAEDVDYEAIADLTDGMVGAQLANLLDIAALTVLRDGRTEITTDDLIQAVQLEEGGYPDMRPRSKELWHMLALNEASMAVAAMNFAEFRDIQLITIIPRMGEEKGGVRIQMDRAKYEICALGRQDVLDFITMQLAPRAADELWYGCDQMSTIWADSYNEARKAARHFVFGGLSERSGFYALVNCWNELDRLFEIDVEVLKILDICYKRALQILDRNRLLMENLVGILLEEKVVRKERIWELVDQFGKLEELPPRAADIRNAQLNAFQEKMMSERRSLRVS
eukprot:c28027_g1_i2 orf=1142-3934(-)